MLFTFGKSQGDINFKSTMKDTKRESMKINTNGTKGEILGLARPRDAVCNLNLYLGMLSISELERLEILSGAKKASEGFMFPTIRIYANSFFASFDFEDDGIMETDFERIFVTENSAITYLNLLIEEAGNSMASRCIRFIDNSKIEL